MCYLYYCPHNNCVYYHLYCLQTESYNHAVEATQENA